MQIAIIGLPQSGKSTLFSAITGGHAHAGAAAAHQVDKAVVKVPDARLAVLTGMYKPKKTTHATLEFVDLPGLNFTDEAGKHEAKRIISQARLADMLVVVVCALQNPSVALYRDRVDPAGNIEELRSEFLLADLDQMANRIDKLHASHNKPSKTQDQDKRELALLERCQKAVENLQPVSAAVQNEEEEKMLRSFAFLTLKPMIVVANINEDKVTEASPLTRDQAGGEVIPLAATLEAELAALPEDELGAFLEEMKLTEIARDRLVRSCYQTLKLCSFLTTGEDEVRAWTIPNPCSAVEAAGAIHTDIQKGFIRAEVVHYDDLIAHTDMKGARAAGKIRLEGKTYIVRDGDIINFRFNV